ncbi:ectoine synthase [bacterium]|nr:ectoine synthase [bacterium]
MIVTKYKDLVGTDRVIEADNWRSCRMLLKKDGMGFSFRDTLIKAGTSTEIHYQNHLEAVYCVGGEGKLHDLDNDVEYTLEDGTMYALSGNERHILTAVSDLRMICVFNPPLVGPETHDENGVYPLLTD